jgi:hypothetical protein
MAIMDSPISLPRPITRREIIRRRRQLTCRPQLYTSTGLHVPGGAIRRQHRQRIKPTGTGPLAGGAYQSTDRDEGRRQDGPTSAEREELTRLRRENRQLRQERDILAKAAAWFARETAVIPSGSSNS